MPRVVTCKSHVATVTVDSGSGRSTGRGILGAGRRAHDAAVAETLKVPGRVNPRQPDSEAINLSTFLIQNVKQT